MAQLVPCSAAFNSTQTLMPPAVLADFNQQNQGGLLEVPYSGGGQTVPSSPTFSTWNYSPPSYWSDVNRSPPMVIKNEPANISNLADGSCDSSLEELLDDYAFDYYDVKELDNNKPIIKQEAHSQGHALLRQCLRPSDYQQRCQLQFLNQIGTAIASSPQREMSIKAEKQQQYWNNGNNTGTAQGLTSVLNLVMEQINEEVRSTCETLGVSPSKFYSILLIFHHLAQIYM